MQCAHITNGVRSLSKEGTWRNPCWEEKPRSASEKMQRRTGVNRSPAYKRRIRIRIRRRMRRPNTAFLSAPQPNNFCVYIYIAGLSFLT